ncbi:MAG: hypothetical protein HN509_15005 [Halobacteriovoraceae bacterium]|jgi:hypothetical protein|nr:hypothetical protein [Halobacteriovoraceae bacterium]MBT5093370.1 hypothetical protein [Halobacteriovoraceae bacterium]
MSAGKKAIAEIEHGKLAPGEILKKFEDGALAVRVLGNPKVQELWDRIIHNRPNCTDVAESSGWKDFFKNGIFTFARNHYKKSTDFGDTHRFERGNFGHVARKMATYYDFKTKEMAYFPPELFNDDNEEARLSQETLKLAWDLAMEINQSSKLENDHDPSQYTVAVEFLKYPDSYQQYQDVLDHVIGGSSWKRIGMKLDYARSLGRGPFAIRFIRDLFAWCFYLPILRTIVNKLNSFFDKRPVDQLEEDRELIGPGHFDGARHLTLLASDRDVMRTDAFDGEKWHELALSTDNFLVFPGGVYNGSPAVKPTLHRYSIAKETPLVNVKSSNITMVLAIATREMFDVRANS